MAYASKYYDPVKAHEYYMKHRKLKGRSKKTSLKGLSKYGKSAAKQVKDSINTEKRGKLKQVTEDLRARINQHSAEMKEKIAALREQRKAALQSARAAAKERTQTKIKALREKLKNMPKDQREAMREQIAGEIDGLRAEYREASEKARQEMNDKFAPQIQALRDEHKAASAGFREEANKVREQIKADAKKSYENEVVKMKKDKKFKR